jgi:two-component system cell cycle response regulator
MDIDYFKHVNDTLGHAGGDEVLREVVRRSEHVLRDDDALGRFGGEEFLLIMVGAGATSFRPVLERVRRAVAHPPVRVAEHVVQVTVSIGGAIGTGQSVDELIREADDALYAAKARGRNQVVLARASGRDGGLATAGRGADGVGATSA